MSSYRKPANAGVFPAVTRQQEIRRVSGAFQSGLLMWNSSPKMIPGRGTRLYGLYRYVRPQRVGFFSRFGHK